MGTGGCFPASLIDKLCTTFLSGPIRLNVITDWSVVCMFCCLNISGSLETISPPPEDAGSLMTAGEEADRWNEDPAETPGVNVEL